MSEKVGTIVEGPPSLQFLRQCFAVDEVHGLIWKHRPIQHFASVHSWQVTNSRCEGKPVGKVGHWGYLEVKMFGRMLKVHRIIFALHHSLELADLPSIIDHINCNKTDNRVGNLRPATNAQNGRNRGLNRNNSSGFKGASWDKHAGRWKAQIRVDGRYKHLGMFDTAEEAGAAYVLAAQLHFGEFARAA